jgi:hypothetical protein
MLPFAHRAAAVAPTAAAAAMHCVCSRDPLYLLAPPAACCTSDRTYAAHVHASLATSRALMFSAVRTKHSKRRATQPLTASRHVPLVTSTRAVQFSNASAHDLAAPWGAVSTLPQHGPNVSGKKALGPAPFVPLVSAGPPQCRPATTLEALTVALALLLLLRCDLVIVAWGTREAVTINRCVCVAAIVVLSLCLRREDDGVSELECGEVGARSVTNGEDVHDAELVEERTETVVEIVQVTLESVGSRERVRLPLDRVGRRRRDADTVAVVERSDPLALAVADCVGEADADRDETIVLVRDCATDTDHVIVPDHVAVKVADNDAVLDMSADLVGESRSVDVADDDTDHDTVIDDVAEAETVGVRVNVSDRTTCAVESAANSVAGTPAAVAAHANATGDRHAADVPSPSTVPDTVDSSAVT